MIKIFQRSWLDIKFDQFSVLNHKEIANNDFYQKFYEIFYKKYANWDNLPATYIQEKQYVSNKLVEMISKKTAKHVLSIGCGNGLIERELIQRLPDIQLTAHECIEANLIWLKSIAQITTCYGEIPACLPTKNYDFIYLSQVDYALSDAQYIHLLKQIRSFTQAPIIFVGVPKPHTDGWAWFKYWVKCFLAKCQLYNLGQLWGYLRHYYEHAAIVEKAGYRIIGHGDLLRGVIWFEVQ